VSFLRPELGRQRIISCADAMQARDGTWVHAAGLILVRQRPGSAKGVMFITMEDETGIANIVVWQKIFEQYRPLILSASMLGVRGRVQREGEVVHLVARSLLDLTPELGKVGRMEAPFPLPHGRGDEFRHGGQALDRRGRMTAKPRDIIDPYLHHDQIRPKTRDFK